MCNNFKSHSINITIVENQYLTYVHPLDPPRRKGWIFCFKNKSKEEWKKKWHLNLSLKLRINFINNFYWNNYAIISNFKGFFSRVRLFVYLVISSVGTLLCRKVKIIRREQTGWLVIFKILLKWILIPSL